MSSGKVFQRLTLTEKQYQSAMNSREMLRVADRPTIEVPEFCMATTLGLDNRDLLPPFMPVQRNEDGIFSATLRKCLDESYCAHLPMAVLHDPVEVRGYEPAFVALNKIRFSDVLLSCINAYVPHDWLPPCERMQSLGKYLMELGSLPHVEFKNYIRLWLSQQAGKRIVHLEKILKEQTDAPEYWSVDIKRAIESLQTAVLKPDYLVPADLLSQRTAEEAKLLSQRLVCRYGELLDAWPSLMANARELATRNCRIAQPILRTAMTCVG
jgi:hypothetical protein